MARVWGVTTVVSLVMLSWAMAASPPGPAVALSSVNLDETKLRVHFIDIGPGLAMLIETPEDRKHVFIDGGKWGLEDLAAYVSHFVDKSKDETIDVAIVTHADMDHYKGMLRIFDAFDVGQFWYTGYESPKLSTIGTWGQFLDKVNSEEGCEVYLPLNDYVAACDEEVIDEGPSSDSQDDIIVHYLNVDDDPPAKDPVSGRAFDEGQRRNNASLVFRLIYKNVSFLITGDVNGRDKEHEGEADDEEIDSEELEMWVRNKLRPDECGLGPTVLQAPHHGSNGSNSLPFLEAVAPDWVVIPAGHEHNHPHPASLRRFKKAGIAEDHILRTDEGDSTPEKSSKKDDTGDESYIFETDGQTITRIVKVKMH